MPRNRENEAKGSTFGFYLYFYISSFNSNPQEQFNCKSTKIILRPSHAAKYARGLPEYCDRGG
jgi:hypothetical protein